MKEEAISIRGASVGESIPADTPPIFELVNVSHRFGNVVALRHVSLRISSGERVALVGPSGAGKSTLLNLLNGSLHPSEGIVRALGLNLAQLSPKRLRQVQRQIGFVYQQFHLVNNLRVVHNVNAGALGRWSFLKAAWSLVWPQEVERAAQALAQVGIPEKLYARTDQLSGGQQQRVALARVLVQDPVAILADEPISNLDPERGREIMDLLFRLSEEMGKTLVVSLHAIEYAYTHCHRIIGLREGSVLFDAPPADVTPDMVTALYRIEKE
jgi:phosphonate transport system ATP-binding protein